MVKSKNILFHISKRFQSYSWLSGEWWLLSSAGFSPRLRRKPLKIFFYVEFRLPAAVSVALVTRICYSSFRPLAQGLMMSILIKMPQGKNRGTDTFPSVVYLGNRKTQWVLSSVFSSKVWWQQSDKLLQVFSVTLYYLELINQWSFLFWNTHSNCKHFDSNKTVPYRETNETYQKNIKSFYIQMLIFPWKGSVLVPCIQRRVSRCTGGFITVHSPQCFQKNSVALCDE